MLSVTAHITTDVASIPLLWIIPLAFYLASFVMAFAEPPLWLGRSEKWLNVMTFTLLSFTLCFTAVGTTGFPWAQVALHYTAFLFAATLCHLKLANLKPPAEQLTFFFLIVSAGGCLGGVFNALLAHHLFPIPFEYIATLTALVAVFAWKRSGFDVETDYLKTLITLLAALAVFLFLLSYDNTMLNLTAAVSMALLMLFYWNAKKAFLMFAVALCAVYVFVKIEKGGNTVHLARNTFGTLFVRDVAKSDVRYLIHGTTLHGMQNLPLNHSPSPGSYYHRNGPLGDMFGILDGRDDAQNIAALGLGVGTVACYTHPGRNFRFFEINQAVIDIATNPGYFTYLSSCQPDAGIILGDARLNMAKEADNTYDLILVDTFSSDSIPVHLMTLEALDIYNQKLKEDGIIAFHVSNRYFDLKPVIAAMANEAGLFYAYNADMGSGGKESGGTMHSASIYVAVSPLQSVIDDLLKSMKGWVVYDAGTEFPTVWTDDYVNIFDAVTF